MVGSDAIAPWICSNNASRIALGLAGIVSFQQRIEHFRLRRKDVSQGLVFEARDTAPLQSSGDEGFRLTVGDRLEAQELALELALELDFVELLIGFQQRYVLRKCKRQ